MHKIWLNRFVDETIRGYGLGAKQLVGKWYWETKWLRVKIEAKLQGQNNPMGGVRGGITSYIYIPVVWMCLLNGPLFQLCQVYDWPLFSAKSIWLAPFFWISIWKAPLFWCIPVHAHIFRSEATCSLGIQWIDCYICLTTSNEVQKIKGQYMNGSTFQTI